MSSTQNSSSSDSNDLSSLSYQQASDELESIIKQLESNQLELEDSLKMYQRGVELLAELRSRLAHAKQRVTALMGEIEADDEEAHDTTLS